jgi:hypothetical protein
VRIFTQHDRARVAPCCCCCCQVLQLRDTGIHWTYDVCGRCEGAASLQRIQPKQQQQKGKQRNCLSKGMRTYIAMSNWTSLMAGVKEPPPCRFITTDPAGSRQQQQRNREHKGIHGA